MSHTRLLNSYDEKPACNAIPSTFSTACSVFLVKDGNLASDAPAPSWPLSGATRCQVRATPQNSQSGPLQEARTPTWTRKLVVFANWSLNRLLPSFPSRVSIRPRRATPWQVCSTISSGAASPRRARTPCRAATLVSAARLCNLVVSCTSSKAGRQQQLLVSTAIRLSYLIETNRDAMCCALSSLRVADPHVQYILGNILCSVTSMCRLLTP